ncbi:hypothetical protein HDU91_003268 [Kappamyces sp. JEL0680]|nr:hypothetical protein HDU91_003268 [Kappamyces sp. JEL0680]
MRAIAIYSCQAESIEEIGFQVGDLILNVRQDEEPGWWYGQLAASGQSGLFPGNYVRFEEDPPGPPIGGNAARFLSSLPEPIRAAGNSGDAVYERKLDAAEMRRNLEQKSSILVRDQTAVTSLDRPKPKQVGSYDPPRPVSLYTQSSAPGGFLAGKPSVPSRPVEKGKPSVPSRPLAGKGDHTGDPFIDHNPFTAPKAAAPQSGHTRYSSVPNPAFHSAVPQPVPAPTAMSAGHGAGFQTVALSASVPMPGQSIYPSISAVQEANAVYPGYPVPTSVPPPQSMDSRGVSINDRLSDAVKAKKKPPPPPGRKSYLDNASTASPVAVQQPPSAAALAHRFEQLSTNTPLSAPASGSALGTAAEHRLSANSQPKSSHFVPQTVQPAKPPIPANRPTSPLSSGFGAYPPSPVMMSGHSAGQSALLQSHHTTLTRPAPSTTEMGSSKVLPPKRTLTTSVPHSEELLEALPRYKQLFAQFDRFNRGLLSGTIVRGIWTRSQLDPRVLADIWNSLQTSSTKNGEGYSFISLPEFCIGMYLIDEVLRGKPVPTVEVGALRNLRELSLMARP